MGVNIRTIAEKANVSVATVSRVINDSDKVRQSTRKKVLDVISDLNYEVNAVARSLKLSKTKTIGLITGNILSSYWSIIARAVHDAATSNGYNIILCCNDDETADEELSYLTVLRSSRVDGIILSPTQNNITYLKMLMNSGIRIVFIDRLIDGIDSEAVLIDDEAGTYKGITYLIEQGYRRIGMLNGPKGILTAEERLKGYLRALREAGIEPDEGLIKNGTWKKESGESFTRELLDGPIRPDAIFAANVELALGSLLQIRRMGMKVPDDIGFLTFSDYEWTTIIDPPLTVVDFSIASIGEKAVDLLMKKIRSQDVSAAVRHTAHTGDAIGKKVIKVPTRLVVRGSTRRM
jgi:DNA-binding LacI/PurR family transcriptional regulator